MLLDRMDVLEKWIIIQFTPYQPTTLPKGMFSQKLLFKSSLLLNGQCGIQVRPQPNSDDLCLLFCLYPFSIVGRNDKFRVQARMKETVSSKSQNVKCSTSFSFKSTKYSFIFLFYLYFLYIFPYMYIYFLLGFRYSALQY